MLQEGNNIGLVSVSEVKFCLSEFGLIHSVLSKRYLDRCHFLLSDLSANLRAIIIKSRKTYTGFSRNAGGHEDSE